MVQLNTSWSNEKFQQKTKNHQKLQKSVMSMVFVSTHYVTGAKNWRWHDILSFLIITFSAALSLHFFLPTSNETWYILIDLSSMKYWNPSIYNIKVAFILVHWSNDIQQKYFAQKNICWKITRFWSDVMLIFCVRD